MLISFDFAAAFPSLAHSWVWAAMVAMAIPEGIMNIFRAVYYMNEIMVQGEHLAFVFAGVLQGCPLSGIVFV